jgi:hypothetical protein
VNKMSDAGRVSARLSFMPDESLNSNHARRLSVTCRHIDKLLADMENALAVAGSKQVFPEYLLDVTPAQRRVIEDYIARIRVQLARVLDGQGVERPEPSIPVSRSLHIALTFINIAAVELQPRYMRGYGEISTTAAAGLNRIAAELVALTTEFDRYVTSEIHAPTQSPEEELSKPERDDTTCSNT